VLKPFIQKKTYEFRQAYYEAITKIDDVIGNLIREELSDI